MRNGNSTSYGMGFLQVLQIVFIVLKFCTVITWSWVWVLCPTWINLTFYLIAVVIAVICARH